MVNEVWFVERLIDGCWQPCMDTGTISELYAKIQLSSLTNCGTKNADKYRTQGYIARADYPALEAKANAAALAAGGAQLEVRALEAENKRLREELEKGTINKCRIEI